MSGSEYLQRVAVSYLLTLYYSLQMLLVFAIAYIKNSFNSPWQQKYRLEPPPRLTDPKYGVHKYIKVNNTVLHYVESGDKSKPLMLFLHGFPEFWYSWRHQILEFQKNYRCIAVDMRGYGDSERTEDVSAYIIEILVEDIRDLVSQLGNGKCILIAHDWGGLVACKFRDMHPDMLLGLVMLASASATSWRNEVWTNPEQRAKSWYVFFYQIPWIPEMACSMNNFAMYDKMMTFRNNTDSEDIECFKFWFRRPYALTAPINYYRANFSCELSEIEKHTENVPMLVAHAQNDAYLNHGILDYMKKEYTHIETTIVENTGHFLQQEDPEKVNKLIKEFLSKQNL